MLTRSGSQRCADLILRTEHTEIILPLPEIFSALQYRECSGRALSIREPGPKGGERPVSYQLDRWESDLMLVDNFR